MYVDIDFYNHIYLNPIDGKVVPYYALSTYDKWVYKDVKSLLLERCPELIDRYLEIQIVMYQVLKVYQVKSMLLHWLHMYLNRDV